MIARGAPARLAGRVALVTGSGRNIGRAIALAFTREGASVVINTRANGEEGESTAREARALGGAAIALLADVSRRDEVERMVRGALSTFGRIDILVNNAASSRLTTPFQEISDEEWRAVVGVILDGAFHCSQAVVPSMIASGAGSIINVSGSSAFRGRTGQAHVLAAKAGLVGLTHALAVEFGRVGVRVNTVVPDLVLTRRSPAATAEVERIRAERPTLLGRNALPEDIADTCVFLAGDESRFITGQTIHVNGGTILT